MIKHFYSYVVETDTLFLELDSLDLSVAEKKHLKMIAESSLHHAIVDVILAELSEDDKKLFLSHLHSHDHDKTWKLLRTKITDIEEKIRKTAHELKKELHKDIREVKKSSS